MPREGSAPRISDIGVARFLMNESLESTPQGVVHAPARGRALFTVIGLMIGAGLVAAAWALTPPSAPEVREVRFEFTPPPSQRLFVQGLDHDVVIAPDGSFIVYRSGAGNLAPPRLMIRAINDTTAREVLGTENARYPFLSHDGRWLGFFVGPEMRKVPVTGGSAVMLCRIGGTPRGASWGDDEFIVFATSDSRDLQRVAAAGGEPKVLAIQNQRERDIVAQPYVFRAARRSCSRP